MSHLKTKLEFEVEKLDSSAIERIKNTFDSTKGIYSTSIDEEKNRVYVDTSLPSANVLCLIENTSKSTAVLRGMGSIAMQKLTAQYGTIAAVSMINNFDNRPTPIRGVIRFVQIDENNCAIDGTIDGLSDGKHALNICEFGDLTKGCESTGEHYNPLKKQHGLPPNDERHAGDLGNINSTNESASLRIVDNNLKVWDIIGRSVCVYEREDLGDGECGRKVACGLIARSAGLFENYKKICSCSGKTVWEERKS